MLCLYFILHKINGSGCLQKHGNQGARILVIWRIKHQYVVFHFQRFIARKSRHALSAVVDVDQLTRRHHHALGVLYVFWVVI